MMGWFSSEEEMDSKSNQNIGVGNNNINHVTRSGSMDILITLILILTVLRFVEIIYFIYTNFIRKIKKRYNGNQSNNLYPSSANL